MRKSKRICILCNTNTLYLYFVLLLKSFIEQKLLEYTIKYTEKAMHFYVFLRHAITTSNVCTVKIDTNLKFYLFIYFIKTEEKYIVFE